MKNSILIALTVLITFSASAQHFEGKVIYKNTYKSKMPEMDSEQFTTLMGAQQAFYIKDGNYKSVTDGTYYQWQLHINSDKKLYTKCSNSTTILWNDSQINSDSILEVTLNKDVIDILGYKCHELILSCKSGVQKYYFNSKLAIDSELFINHKFGNWYDYLKKSNALPLKMKIDNEQFSMESTAVEVTSLQLDQAYFQLPANATIAKSPN